MSKEFDAEVYKECSKCGYWHAGHFKGGCQDRTQRYVTSELEDHYGQYLFWQRMAYE